MMKKMDKGFTLIELMIVVAIIGILAAIAIPGFMQYIKNSKTTEAKTNLNAISKGALSYFETEHISQDGLSASSKQYPVGDSSIGITPSSASIGQKVVAVVDIDPATKALSTDAKNITGDYIVWEQLNYNIKGAIYYQYTYKGVGSGGTGDSATPSYYNARAAASLSAANDSAFCLSGGHKGTVSPIKEDCEAIGTSDIDGNT